MSHQKLIPEMAIEELSKQRVDMENKLKATQKGKQILN